MQLSLPLFWPLGKSTYTTASHHVTKAKPIENEVYGTRQLHDWFAWMHVGYTTKRS